MDLKIKQGESWIDFSSRIILNYKDYGFTSKEEVVTKLTGVPMRDNSRKIHYGLRNLQKAYESGYYKQFVGEESVGCKKEELNSFYKTDNKKLEDELELAYNTLTKTEKTLQRVRDENTLLRAEKRLGFRSENGDLIQFEDILKEIKCNPIIKPSNPIIDYSIISNKSIILALSDSHYNFTQEEEDELVKTYIEKVELNLDGYIPEEIIFAFVGDLINHSRYSKKYTNLYTQGEAITKTYKMFGRIMNHFISNYPSIKYKACGVCGNEATGEEGYMNDPIGNYENGDYRIFQMLKAKFEHSVEFLNNGNDVSFVFSVRGRNCLINHGVFQMKLSNRKNIEDFHHKMSNVALKETGDEVDFTLTAHIHQNMNINNRIFRNASFEGSNSYSRYALGIADSYRNQNMIVVTDYGWHCRVLEF